MRDGGELFGGKLIQQSRNRLAHAFPELFDSRILIMEM